MPSLKRLKKRHIIIIFFVVCLVPFPTEMVPEWQMTFYYESGQPASNVKVDQSWQSYTYIAVSGVDHQCTDKDGKVVFPTRHLWSGLFGRIFSPLVAEAMTLAHGSTGTNASIQVFDRDFISDNYYWRDKMSLYSHNYKEFPSVGLVTVRQSQSLKTAPCR